MQNVCEIESTAVYARMPLLLQTLSYAGESVAVGKLEEVEEVTGSGHLLKEKEETVNSGELKEKQELTDSDALIEEKEELTVSDAVIAFKEKVEDLQFLLSQAVFMGTW
jgi:hypothetical protein